MIVLLQIFSEKISPDSDSEKTFESWYKFSEVIRRTKRCHFWGHAIYEYLFLIKRTWYTVACSEYLGFLK